MYSYKPVCFFIVLNNVLKLLPLSEVYLENTYICPEKWTIYDNK